MYQTHDDRSIIPDLNIEQLKVLSNMARGCRVRYFRELRGYKLFEFAKIIGCVPSDLSKFENGQYEHTKYIDKIIRVLGIPADLVLFGKDVQRILYMFDTPAELVDWVIKEDKFFYGVKLKFKIMSDAMRSPTNSRPTFESGDYIVVDPKKKPKANGNYPDCFVLAAINGSDEYVFRQLVKDHDKTYLRALNPAYQNIDLTNEVKIVATLKTHTY